MALLALAEALMLEQYGIRVSAFVNATIMAVVVGDPPMAVHED